MPHENDSYQALADRFQAIGAFFTGLANARDAQVLVDAMLGEDAKVFSKYLDRVDFPPDLNIPIIRCEWVSNLVEVLIRQQVTVTYYVLKRLDPNNGETREYLRCLALHRDGVVTRKRLPPTYEERTIIEGEGLRQCLAEKKLIEIVRVDELSIVLAKEPDKPFRFCLQAPPG